MLGDAIDAYRLDRPFNLAPLKPHPLPLSQRWLLLHRSLGLAAIGMGAYNSYLGIRLLKRLEPSVDENLWLAACGAPAVLLLLSVALLEARVPRAQAGPKAKHSC